MVVTVQPAAPGPARGGHLVVVLHPLLGPLNQLLQVALQVLGGVAGQLVDDLLAVGLPGLLVDGLEDLALHVVLQLLPRVAPGRGHTRGQSPRQAGGGNKQ